MRFWIVLTTPRTCGRCASRMPTGATALRMTLGPADTALWRCTACAGQPPAHLVLDAEPTDAADRRSQFLARVADLARRFAPVRDWKSRQSGEPE